MRTCDGGASIPSNLTHLMTHTARGSNTVTKYFIAGLVTTAHSTLGVIIVNYSESECQVTQLRCVV
jgi:hypothetical protein